MEPKRFIGNDMARIYQRVRRELGPDAVIVETRSLLREGAEPLIELLAMAPDDGAVPFALQGQMVSGVLARVERQPLPRTIGDLEDLAAREYPAEEFDDSEYVEPVSPDWLQGYVDEAPASPPSARPPFAPLAPQPEEPVAPLRFAPRPQPRQQPLHTQPSTAAEEWVQEPQARTASRFTPIAPGDGGTFVSQGFSPAAALIIEPHARPSLAPEEALADCLAAMELAYPEEQRTAIITIQGPAGAGRTTALIRMALDCSDSGRPTILVAADTSRIAGREQIHAYAEALGLEVVDAYSHQELVHAVAAAPRGACLFVDVPGGPWQAPAIPAVSHFSYLAIPAHWQPESLDRALSGYPRSGHAGSVLTFTDLAASLVPALTATIERRLGIAFLSSSRDVTTGIEVAELLTLASGAFTTPSGVTTNGRLVATA